MDGSVDPERHRVPELLLGFLRAERERHRLAAMCLDEAHRLLDPAFLVRADREAEVPCLDRLLVVGEDDPARPSAARA